MATKTGESFLKKAVKFIYGDLFKEGGRLLDAKLEASTHITELAEAIRQVKSYNAFNGDDVADVLLKLHHDGVLMNVAFGREYSPVLYITVPYWSHQTSLRLEREWGGGEEGKPFSSEGREMFKRIVTEAMEKLEPDELNWDEHGTLRVWWD